MAEVEAGVEIPAPLAEVWDLYFDPVSWPAWVDGFARVEASSGYPEAGGTLRWSSGAAGRGTVSERVLAHEPRTLHRIAYVDPGSEGQLETRFEMLPAGEEGRRTRVTQRQRYRVTGGGPLAGLTDVLFIRAQMRRSLERSLADLRLLARGRRGVQPD